MPGIRSAAPYGSGVRPSGRRWSTGIGRASPLARENRLRRRKAYVLADKRDGRPLDIDGQAGGCLEGCAAGKHAAVGHMPAVMTLAGRTLAGAALRADDVAEKVALDRRGGDGEGGLQDERQRRDESREPCRDPVVTLSHEARLEHFRQSWIVAETFHLLALAQIRCRNQRAPASACSMHALPGNRGACLCGNMPAAYPACGANRAISECVSPA